MNYVPWSFSINAAYCVNQNYRQYRIPVNVNDDGITMLCTWRDLWSIHKKVCTRFPMCHASSTWVKPIPLSLWKQLIRPVIRSCIWSLHSYRLNVHFVHFGYNNVMRLVMTDCVKDGWKDSDPYTFSRTRFPVYGKATMLVACSTGNKKLPHCTHSIWYWRKQAVFCDAFGTH